MKSSLPSSTIPPKHAPPIIANGTILKHRLSLQITLAQIARVTKQCEHPKHPRPRRPKRTEQPRPFHIQSARYLLAQQIFSQQKNLHNFSMEMKRIFGNVAQEIDLED